MTTMIKRGEEWSRPLSENASVQVSGNDLALAACVKTQPPGALIAFTPDPSSDLARAIGLTSAPRLTSEVILDALDVDGTDLACNMVIVGTAPDRLRRRDRRSQIVVTIDGAPWFEGPATTVLVASGQFLRGADAIPRGHPGDGRAEVQVYALAARERRAMRARFPSGAHVPHPRIAQRTGKRVEITATRPLPIEVDGSRREPTDHLVIDVVPGRYRLVL